MLEVEFGNNSKYLRAVEQGRIVTTPIANWFECAKNKITILVRSNYFDLRARYEGNGDTHLNMYKVKGAYYDISAFFYAGPFSPHLNAFNHFAALAFEAGLANLWELYYEHEYVNFKNLGEVKKKFLESLNDGKILDLKAIAPFFIIWAFGLLLALFALFCEIFYHDFVCNLSQEFFERKFTILREIKLGEILKE